MNTAPFPSPTADLSASIRAMRGEVGDWGAQKFFTWVVASLLHRLLGRIVGRMEGLVARFLAGRVLRRVARVEGPVAEAEAAAAGEAAACARPGPRLPGGFLWLVKAAGYHAMAYHHQLRHVLAQPEMVALLTACPQAARVLRPLCRALGVETSLLRPGVPVVVREKQPARVRVRKPRVPIDWGRIPLPRGVLSAARRAGFKPVR